MLTRAVPAFNQFVEDILKFNAEMTDASIPQDARIGIPFYKTFEKKLDKMENELIALVEAVEKFKGEVPALPKPEEAKREDHNSPSTEEWGEPGPAYKHVPHDATSG